MRNYRIQTVAQVDLVASLQFPVSRWLRVKRLVSFTRPISRSGNNFQEIIEGWLDNGPDQDKHLIGSGFGSDVV